jgi:hypothetical protein
MKIDGDRIVFSSGKVRYANNGIIGLSPHLGVTEGYDGDLWVDGLDNGDLSHADMVELADYMIEQWGNFKASHARRKL